MIEETRYKTQETIKLKNAKKIKTLVSYDYDLVSSLYFILLAPPTRPKPYQIF